MGIHGEKDRLIIRRRLSLEFQDRQALQSWVCGRGLQGYEVLRAGCCFPEVTAGGQGTLTDSTRRGL